MRILLLLISALFWLQACGTSDSQLPATDLADLPADTGGLQTSHPLGSDDSPFGYLLYEPSGSGANSALYPLLIYLHGSGGKNDTSDAAAALASAAKEPVPSLIARDKWKPPFPLIVASPHSGALSWDKSPNPENLRAFIRFLIAHYPVNPERVYLTGYSMGGYGVYSYLASYGDSSGVAAAVPIAGSGWAPSAKKIRVPIWAFHGADDSVVKLQGDLDMIDSLNASHPAVRARITVFPGVGHNDVVYPVYDGSGMGKESASYTAFQTDIYSWLAQYRL